MCYLLFAIAYVIDPLTMFYACYKILKPKYQSKIPYIAGCLILYLYIIIKQIIMFYYSPTLFGMLVLPLLLLFMYFFSHCLFDGTIKRRIIIIVSLLIIEAFTDGISLILFAILHMPYDIMSHISAESAILTFIVRFINLGINIVFYKLISLKIKVKKIDSIQVIIGYSIISILYLYIATWYIGTSNSYMSYFYTGFQIVMVIFFAYYVIQVILQKSRNELEAMNKAELIEQQLLITNHAKNVTKKLRTLRHDMNAHYICLRSLLQNEMYDQALNYIDELCADVEESKDICIADNYVLSVIISNKAEECRRKKIRFNRTIMTENFPIPYSEQNSLLSNILNNAIEAVEKLPKDRERMIDLEIAPRPNGQVHICCMNTANEDAVIMVNKKSFFTTKKDKENHGIGLAAIKKIVEKNGGSLVINYSHSNFILTIDLISPKESSVLRERQIISR